MNNLINLNEKMNLYEQLEININSSDDEIKKAWKKLALKYHPDKNKNSSSNKFIKIKYAYDILSNKYLKEQYDNQLKFTLKTNNYYNIFDVNYENFLSNFINSTETEKIFKLMIIKKETINNFFSLSNICNNFDDFIKKIIDIVIIIDYDLKDIWLCNSKYVKYDRYTKNIFEENIYPIDFEQIYENEGEEITINNILYKGNLTIKINVINTIYSGENYYVFDDELYILINNNRIKNNKFKLIFLDDNEYKFNITKLNKIKNKIGDVYFKKNFGFMKFLSDDIVDKKDNDYNINDNTNITYSNLFFIIIL